VWKYYEKSPEIDLNADVRPARAGQGEPNGTGASSAAMVCCRASGPEPPGDNLRLSWMTDRSSSRLRPTARPPPPISI